MKQFKNTKALLLVVGIVLLMAACTAAWQRGRNENNKQELGYQKTKADSLSIESFIKQKWTENGYTTIIFDSSVCERVPDFTLANIYTKPEYKALFGWTDDYTVETNVKPHHPIRLMYKNVPLESSNSAIPLGLPDKCYTRLEGFKFIPEKEPSEVKISLDEARNIALQQEYEYTERQKSILKKMKDSLGYDLKWHELYPFAKNKYLPNAKFAWEKRVPEPADSIYYPKGELVYAINTTPNTPLLYKFDIHTITATWRVWIDPITGKLVYKSRMNQHITCEPNDAVVATMNDLWYYNTPTPINISSCNFGSCTRYRLSNDGTAPNTRAIQAFCQDGFFDDPDVNTNPRKTFIDWTANGNNKHFSPSISLTSIALPSTISSTDGTANISITSNMSGSYSYNGMQILTTNNFAGNSITQTQSGTNLNALSAGMYQLTISDDALCTYTEYVAMGMQNGPLVTGNIIEAADCYNNTGSIEITIDNTNSFGGQLPQIIIKGAINTNAFAPPSNFDIQNNQYKINLTTFNNNQPLPAGNYAILVLNPNNGKVGSLNIRINYPDCIIERKVLQTAYWAFERTNSLFKQGSIDGINGGNAINLNLGNNVVVSVSTFNGTPTTGLCQFATSNKPIGIGLVNDGLADNAELVALSLNNPETLFKIGSGTTAYPIVALDVLAHEYAHAINAAGMKVKTDGSQSVSAEADAIDEAFSDIVGIIVESTAESSVDWTIGEGTNMQPRHINNPMGDGKPSIYQGTNWATTGDAESVKYTNSRVFSYWFYLLTQGGSQTVNGITYTVTGIGMEKAAKITLAAFVSNSFGLNVAANKNYMGLCKATLLAANALYPAIDGVCSPEVQAVRQAWQAVGVLCPPPPGLTCSLCLPTDPDNNTCDNHLPYISSVLIQDGDIA